MYIYLDKKTDNFIFQLKKPSKKGLIVKWAYYGQLKSIQPEKCSLQNSPEL